MLSVAGSFTQEIRAIRGRQRAAVQWLLAPPKKHPAPRQKCKVMTTTELETTSKSN